MPLPLLAPAITAVGGLVGGMLSNQESAASTQKQMDFQRDMSSTAYQRSVADMKAAGLNPMMMFGGGGPESTPSGSSYTAQNVLGPTANAAVSSGLQAEMQDKTFDVMDVGIKKTGADIDLTEANTALTELQEVLSKVQARVGTSSAVGAESANVEAKALADLQRAHPTLTGWAAFVKSLAGALGSTARGIKEVGSDGSAPSGGFESKR
nr:MAG: DNA pilot protein [Microviridae sp.]